jgi:hypothetical protein
MHVPMMDIKRLEAAVSDADVDEKGDADVDDSIEVRIQDVHSAVEFLTNAWEGALEKSFSTRQSDKRFIETMKLLKCARTALKTAAAKDPKPAGTKDAHSPTVNGNVPNASHVVKAKLSLRDLTKILKPPEPETRTRRFSQRVSMPMIDLTTQTLLANPWDEATVHPEIVEARDSEKWLHLVKQTVAGKNQRDTVVNNSSTNTTMLDLSTQNLTTEGKRLHDAYLEEDEDVDKKVILGYGMWPTSPVRLTMDVGGMFMIAYDSFFIPYNLVFYPEADSLKDPMFWLALSFWQTDMILSMFSGYVDKDGTIVLSIPRILKKYVQFWFWLDCLVVGADWIVVLQSTNRGLFGMFRSVRVLRMVRSLRLLRMAKLKKIVEAIRDQTNSEYFDAALEVIKSITLIMGLNHYVACIWFFAGSYMLDAEDPSSFEEWKDPDNPIDKNITWVLKHNFEGEDASVVYKYLTSLHWSLTQFTPAAMEVVSTNRIERLISVITLVFALIVFGSFLSSMTASVSKIRNGGAEREKQASNLRRYLNNVDIPESLKIRVRKYADHRSASMANQGLKKSDVKYLGLLSKHLDMEMNYYANRKQVILCPLFYILHCRAKPQFMQVLSSCMTTANVAPGDVLFSVGETAHFVIFLTRGKVKYSLEGGEDLLLRQGARLAEIALWSPWNYVGTATAVASGEIISFDVDKYVTALLKNGKAANLVYDFGEAFFGYASEGHDQYVEFLELNRGLINLDGSMNGEDIVNGYRRDAHTNEITRRQYNNTKVYMYGDLLENIEEPVLRQLFEDLDIGQGLQPLYNVMYKTYERTPTSSEKFIMNITKRLRWIVKKAASVVSKDERKGPGRETVKKMVLDARPIIDEYDLDNEELMAQKLYPLFYEYESKLMHSQILGRGRTPPGDNAGADGYHRGRSGTGAANALRSPTGLPTGTRTRRGSGF